MLLCGTDARSATDQIAARCHELAAEVESSGVGIAAAAFVPKLLGVTSQRMRPALLEEIHAMICENTPVGIGAALRAMAARPDATSILARIRCPVIYLAGDEDALTPLARVERGTLMSAFFVVPFRLRPGAICSMVAPQDALHVDPPETDPKHATREQAFRIPGTGGAPCRRTSC